MRSDFDLLAEYRAGSSAAFSALMSRHINWVYSVALRRVGEPHLAEDVTQTVFIALAGDSRLREGGSLPAWLFRVVRYASAKALRTEARRQHHEAEAGRQREEDQALGESRWNDIAPLIEGAVERLGPRDRQVILLRYYQQLDFSQVGAALSISEEGARKRVSRAIAKLQKHFGAHGVVVPAASLATTMSAQVTQAAPFSLPNAILTASPSRVARVKALVPYPPVNNLLRYAIAGTAAAVALGFGIFSSSRNQTAQPALPVAAGHPQSKAAIDPATRPSDLTYAQIIAGVKQNEGRIQNVYIRNFETTVSKRSNGETQWKQTPLTYAGSAWYDGDAQGKARVYFSEQVVESLDGGPSLRDVRDMSWDGSEGRDLTIASEMSGRGLQRMRNARISSGPPVFLDTYNRWETGVGFTLSHMVMEGEGSTPVQPRVPLWQQLQWLDNPRSRPQPARQTVNGFDAILVRFAFDSGSINYWFDPARDFSIVKSEIELHAPTEQRTEGLEVQELKELSPGIWFPLRASMVKEDVSNMGNYLRYDYRSEGAVINDPHFSPQIFKAEIPSGWFVMDDRQTAQKRFVTMEDGTQLEIHTGDSMPRMKAGPATRPDGEGVALKGSAWW